MYTDTQASKAVRLGGGRLGLVAIDRTVPRRALIWAASALKRIAPPVIAVALLLVTWQVLCSGSGATLPPPLKVFSDTWELIADPFFDRGAIDKGLFWHLYASLKRVAIGYSLAAVAGVALGVLVGQSALAFRGL